MSSVLCWFEDDTNSSDADAIEEGGDLVGWGMGVAGEERRGWQGKGQMRWDLVPLSRVDPMASLIGAPSTSPVRSMEVGLRSHCCRTICL